MLKGREVKRYPSRLWWVQPEGKMKHLDISPAYKRMSDVADIPSNLVKCAAIDTVQYVTLTKVV